MIPLVLLLLGFQDRAPQAGGEVTAEQFRNLMAGIRAEIHDVMFIYEGDLRFVGDDSLLGDDPEARRRQLEVSYQGTYAYRSDGATSFEVFVNDITGTGPLKRTRAVLLNGKMTKLEHSPDLDLGYGGKPRVRPAAPGAMGVHQTPELILFLWFFDFLGDPSQDGRYVIQGWEEVDGRLCLRVQFDRTPNADLPAELRQTIRFWLDMERMGHPLKVEYYKGQNLSGRTDQIELSKVATEDGREVWLPRKGRDSGFEWNGEFHAKPVIIQDVGIVAGSAIINKGLPDGFFSIERKGGLPDNAELARLRKAVGKPSPSPRPRITPESIQAQLDQKLAEADRQSKMLDASPSGQHLWDWSIVAQFGLILGGVLLLGSVAFWRWRAG